jgi:hypothetical protein
MLDLNWKVLGFNGTASSHKSCEVADSIYRNRRILGSLVGHFFGLRDTWQQFKRHIGLDGSSQLAVAAISFNWPDFGRHFGAFETNGKAPASCRRSLCHWLFAFFRQHFVAGLA